MKIVAISDTHNHQVDLPEGDLLIVAGDLTGTGTLSQVAKFNDYLVSQAHKFTYRPIVIAGNHDFLFETDKSVAIQQLSAADYIEDQLVTVNGVKIFGSPWTPTFFDWAFMKDRGEPIRHYWNAIPEGLDLLVTHGPPWGILDFCGDHVGCADLLTIVTEELKTPPKYHIFGHIHEGYGKHITDKTTFLNVAICNERYKPVHPVTVFEIA
ncbi:MAG: metallophosphatase domain-containing protein [Candidatus Obscuribacterales bacterium]|nr:metallophosphatase domain-containing protein [Candidatus Obscuribacterales bacterium]